MQLIDSQVSGAMNEAGLFRVAPNALKLGHKVIRLDCAWSESPFPGPSLLIETFEQKRQVAEVCKWVVVDVSSSPNPTRPKGLQVEPLYESLPTLPARVDLLQRSRLSGESMRVALRIYWTLSRRVADFILSFRGSGRLDMKLALSISSLLAQAQNVSLAALIWMTRIKSRRYYHAQHSVNTAILMAGFVHALNWDQDRVQTAALVGLLHDLGKARVDPKLLQKPGHLTDAEFEELKMHPVIGYELLKQNPELSWEVSSAIYASHERPDGAGYPRGLTGDAIPLMARLIAIVDAYDAMTSERAHGHPLSHQKALGVLWKERDRQFDQRLVEAFIQFLGWVPPGTLVRLSDERLAVAIEMQANGSVRPLVRPIVGTSEAFELGPELLLPPQFGGESDAPLRIAELLADNAEGFAMRELTRKLFDALDLVSEAGPDEVLTGQGLAAASIAQSTPAVVPGTDRMSALPEPELPSLPFAGLRCLVVDDSVTVRRTLSNLLDREGFEVRSVESGEDALPALAEGAADVVFLDILLPGMSGFSVLREFRRKKLLENMAVVMISGNPQATEQFFLERIGADDFLPKPFGQPDVEACLRRLVRSQRLKPLQERPAAGSDGPE
ncbi:MAG: HD domain-containing phosphohydrolase [Wenzhouxiangella sp.]